MSDSKYEIATLADDYEIKRRVFEAHKMFNICGLTPEKQSEAMQSYHIAEAEMMRALTRLERAKRQYAEGV